MFLVAPAAIFPAYLQLPHSIVHTCGVNPPRGEGVVKVMFNYCQKELGRYTRYVPLCDIFSYLKITLGQGKLFPPDLKVPEQTGELYGELVNW